MPPTLDHDGLMNVLSSQLWLLTLYNEAEIENPLAWPAGVSTSTRHRPAVIGKTTEDVRYPQK